MEGGWMVMKSWTARATGMVWTGWRTWAGHVNPVAHGVVEALAEFGPLGLKQSFVESGILVVEFAAGDFEQFGVVDFLGAFANEPAIEDQFGGVGLLLGEGFEAAVNGAVAEDDIDIDRFDGVHPMHPVEGLLELVVGPRIGDQDDVVGQVEGMAFGHAHHARAQDRNGPRVDPGLFEQGGFLAALLLVDPPIEGGMAHARLAQLS
jgi:hypothetical protein